MNHQTLWLSLICIAMLSACGAASEKEGGSESFCKANIAEQLLNPETLEMYDFQPINKESYSSLRGQIIVDNMEPSKLAAGARAGYSEERVAGMGKKEALAKIEAIEGNGTIAFELFSARIRAEGPTGNKITKTAACLSLPPGVCNCSF